MKKAIKILIFILMTTLIVGCSGDQEESKEADTSKETTENGETLPVTEETSGEEFPEESKEADEDSDDINDKQETDSDNDSLTYGKATDYISFEGNMRYHYKGEGNEYATFDTYVDYVSDNKIQFRTDNGGTTSIQVIKKNSDNLSRNLFVGEAYYRENLIDKEDSTKDIILMDPIKKGTSWTISDDRQRSITDVQVEVTSPLGTYTTIEVTTSGQEDGTVREYFAKNIGLVKRVYNQEGMTVTSTLENLEKNVPFTQTVRFYYPKNNLEDIVYEDKQISFNTNDMTKLILEREYKKPEKDNASPVLPADASIMSLYLHRDNSVYIDFTEELVTQMNAGAGYEALILQSIANTFANYYGVEHVYLTVENEPYQSGHIILDKGEKLKMDIKNVVE